MDKKIVNELRRKNEILPNEFDGTYRSVRKAVDCYSKLRKTTLIDYNDLDLLYYLSLGVWKNDKNERKAHIQKSHLLHNDKLLFDNYLEKVWSKDSVHPCCRKTGNGLPYNSGNVQDFRFCKKRRSDTGFLQAVHNRRRA